MTASLFAPALSLVLEIARSCRVEPDPLLQEQSIDPGAVGDPERRLRLDLVLRFFDSLEHQLPESSCGLRAHSFWNPNVMGVLGHAWLTSRTLRAAFGRLVRFSRILSEGAVVGLEEDSRRGTLALQVRFREQELAPFLRMDATMAMILAMGQALVEREFTPVRVALAHPAPRDRKPYEALFRCAVSFDTPVCEFVVPVEAADAPRTPSPAHSGTAP